MSFLFWDRLTVWGSHTRRTVIHYIQLKGFLIRMFKTRHYINLDPNLQISDFSNTIYFLISLTPKHWTLLLLENKLKDIEYFYHLNTVYLLEALSRVFFGLFFVLLAWLVRLVCDFSASIYRAGNLMGIGVSLEM